MSTVKGNCASAAYWWLTRGATCGTVICISCFQPPTCDWHMWIKLMTNMSAEGKITPVLRCCENAATDETQYAAHVNKFLIALAAVQTSEIVAKKEKKKNVNKRFSFSGVKGAYSYQVFSLWEEGQSVLSDLCTECGSLVDVWEEEKLSVVVLLRCGHTVRSIVFFIDTFRISGKRSVGQDISAAHLTLLSKNCRFFGFFDGLYCDFDLYFDQLCSTVTIAESFISMCPDS